MSSIVLSPGATGAAAFTIEAPSTATSRVITLPDATDTLVGKATTDTLTNKTLVAPALGTPASGNLANCTGAITSGTAQASTSGTSIDFTGIPSGVKRVTVMFNGVSTNGTSDLQIRLGDAGGVENSGYLGAGVFVAGSTAATAYTAGFGVRNQNGAACVLLGSIILTLENASTFSWTAQGIFAGSDGAYIQLTSGSKSTSAQTDRVRITTVNGTDTFDAGEINILYES